MRSFYTAGTPPVEWSGVDALITPEPWMQDANCASTEPEVFFPERGAPLAPARAICNACPARDACLEFALRTNQRHGIWAGTTGHERATMRRAST